MKCKFCNADQTKEFMLLASPHNRQIYILYECQKCLSRFFDIYQHNVSIKALYEEIATDNSNLSRGFSPTPYWEHQKRIALELLKTPLTSILDVGCRTGDFLLHFKGDYIKEGIEISNYCSEIAQQRGLNVYNDSLENIKFDKKYDIVSAFAILEHLIDPIQFLDKLKSLVNIGGLLIVLIPTFECLKVKILTKFNMAWHMYRPPEHLNFFSEKFLDSYLRSNGYRLIRRNYTSGGLFNPVRKIPMLNSIFNKFMFYFNKSRLNRIPFFDHSYSYYQKII